MFMRVLFLALLAVTVYVGYQAVRGYMTLRHAVRVPPAYEMANGRNPALTIVEFNSYGCFECQELHNVLMQAVADMPDLRVVFRPVPENDPESIYRVRLALAAGMQGQFLALHKAILETYRTMNDDTLAGLADRAGIDVERLKRDADSPAVEGQLKDNETAIRGLRVPETPTLLIGRTLFVPGKRTPTVEELRMLIDEARNAS